MEQITMMDCGDAIRRPNNGCFGRFVVLAAAITLKATDVGKIYVTRGTSGDVNVTLPPARNGMWFGFVKAADGMNVIPASPSLIVGGSSYSTFPSMQVVLVVSDGTDWFIVGNTA